MRKIFAFILKIQKRSAARKLRRRGLSSEEAASENIISGKSWDDFCDLLKDAGGAILGFDSPLDSLTRSEGFRYLSRLTRAGLENFVEGGNTGAPVLRRLVHETVKMGNDNPDFYYQSTIIDGRRRYRITGNLGTTPFLIFSTQEGDYSDSAGASMPIAGQLSTDEMLVGENGRIEIILSNEREGENWLRTTPDTKMLMVRELFGDRDRERTSVLRVEALDKATDSEVLEPKHLEDGLNRAGQLVAGASLLFARWSREFSGTTNQLPRFNQERSNAAGGDPQMAYYHSYWSLKPGRALVVETTPPECATWNFVLSNHWLESLDYRFSQIHVNKHTAYYRPDGSVRILICHENPELPNWLHPQGHDFGGMCFRWNRADSYPQPTIREIDINRLSTFRDEESQSPAKRLEYIPSIPKGRGNG